jgi:hypothetical protein
MKRQIYSRASLEKLILCVALVILSPLVTVSSSQAQTQFLQKISAADSNADSGTADGFGSSVAISGDTAIVGTPGDDSPVTDGGAAYIFVHNGGVWMQQAKLVPSDLFVVAFGMAVAISGDTVIVGAQNQSPGSAHVFVRNGTTWTE